MKKGVIAVIGCGVVGSAVAEFYRDRGHAVIEQDPRFAEDRYHDIGASAELAFVCVPTPTAGKSQDLTAVYDVMASLKAVSFDGVVVLKSTVLPGTCDLITAAYPEIRLVHNPEFLTAAKPLEDLIDQPAALLSGEHAVEAADIAYIPHQIPCYVSHDYRVTELAKYLHNTFLATKVAFMNQFHDVCGSLGVPYDRVIEFAVSQERIGENHTRVPGPDGSKGFGGACFIKDTEALLLRFRELMPLLDAATKYNREVRPGAYDGTERTGYSASEG